MTKWFNPKGDTGWDMDDSPTTRRRRVLKASKGDHLTAARKMLALANIHKSSPHGSKKAYQKAQQDANYFFRMNKKYGK